jgi:ATP-dependent Lon protease
VLIPRDNAKDLAEIPEKVREDLQFVLVENMDQVLENALDRPREKAAVRPDEGEAEAAHYAH